MNERVRSELKRYMGIPVVFWKLAQSQVFIWGLAYQLNGGINQDSRLNIYKWNIWVSATERVDSLSAS